MATRVRRDTNEGREGGGGLERRRLRLRAYAGPARAVPGEGARERGEGAARERSGAEPRKGQAGERVGLGSRKGQAGERAGVGSHAGSARKPSRKPARGSAREPAREPARGSAREPARRPSRSGSRGGRDKLAGRPPRVGSGGWYDELAEIGTGRDELDELWARTVGGRSAAHVDPHEVRLGGEAPGLVAAFWVAFHQRAPGYGAMMHLRHVFVDARRGGRASARLAEWVVRQIAAMVASGPAGVRKSALYGLAVDYFEDQSDAKYVFARLVAQLPREAWGALLPVTGPVAWRDKAEVYRACAGDAALHGPLMEALEGSIHGLFGQADLREVGRLVAALPAEACSEKVRAALAGPIKVWVGEVRVAPRRTPPPWRDSYLLGVRVLSTLPGGNWGLKAGSELMARGEVVGVVRHVFVPDDPEIAWRSLQAPEVDAETKLVFLRIEGPKRSLPRLVGREAELYLPGLRSHLRGRRGEKAAPAPVGAAVAKRLSFLQEVADDFGRRNRG